RYWMNLPSSDVMWNTSDSGWVKSAWSSVFAPWICGSCVFARNMPQFKSAVIAEVSVTFYTVSFISLRTLFHLLFLSSYKFTSLKHCVSGGELLNPEAMAKWKIQTGLGIYEGYGQTETVTIYANMKGMEIKPGSLGKAVPP
ncbi:UNVERIFIED_CONTAM: Acyl-coenzyme A synthetase ACSM3, mitochondrial, partial [Eudyptes pachyrhynchus]